MICTPDHWHALPTVAAAEHGKDIFIEKPLSLTIKEGRAMSGRGSQEKAGFSWSDASSAPMPGFETACELVRNGRIGELRTVKVGLPTDPAGKDEPTMPVPSNLNYDMWLGSTPLAPYTEKRVHPNKDYSRPGWLRIQAYGAGMITGWGAHPQRHRPVGYGNGIHRARGNPGKGRLSQERIVGCARKFSHRSMSMPTGSSSSAPTTR